MKVKISFSIDIDPEDWTLNFGLEGDKDIREDVKERAEYLVTQQFILDGINVR